MDEAMNQLKRDRQFRPLPVPSVELQGLFGDRQDAICDSTAETLLDRCVEAGMLQAIDVTQPSPGVVIPIGPWGGTTQMFWDSDLGKSIETVAYSLYRRPNPQLEARVDQIIDMYEKLQDKDGYLNAWFQRVQPGRRWTNLRDHHELYCAGHLIEGAVAYYQATGKKKLLDIMSRYADYLITVFGHGPGQFPGYCGHEEVELALVKLARVTGEKKYLDLSKFFIDERGTEPHFFTDEAARDGRSAADFHQKTYEYGQAHLPVREQKKVVGHAVRAMYLYAGMADIATEYNDDTLTSALETLWDDLTTKQMYVTGGIGPAASNEGFTDYYPAARRTSPACSPPSAPICMRSPKTRLPSISTGKARHVLILPAPRSSFPSRPAIPGMARSISMWRSTIPPVSRCRYAYRNGPKVRRSPSTAKSSICNPSSSMVMRVSSAIGRAATRWISRSR
jgi:DUF1680 family protein